MTTPSGHIRSLSAHLRQRLEQQTARRLSLAKALRQTPDATNVQLATMFGVSRNTIQLDREAIMEQLVASTKTESELLRVEMVQKLDGLIAEVEKHRKSDGKLPLSAIDQILSITKSLIEVTGCRKPVVEKFFGRVTHELPRFFVAHYEGRPNRCFGATVQKAQNNLQAGEA